MTTIKTKSDAILPFASYSYQTSEQHEDATEARKLCDYNDTLDLIDYLSQDQALRCIATGVLADEEVNVDKCKEVGDKVLCSMVGKNAHDYSYHKKHQAVTLVCNTAVRLTEGNVQVDPQLLFQRLSFVATRGQYGNPQSFFKF